MEGKKGRGKELFGKREKLGIWREKRIEIRDFFNGFLHLPKRFFKLKNQEKKKLMT